MRRCALALLLVAGCRRETPAPDVPLKNVVASTRATTKGTNVEGAKEWTFSLRGETYRLARDGRFTCGMRGSMQVDLRELPHVEELQYVQYDTNILLLLYELSDGEGALSKIGKVHLPTCALGYTAEIPGFNLGPATLEGTKLYVSSIGFVGRFDVEAWAYDWTHGNLYESHGLNGFAAPVLYRDHVVFPESTSDSKAPRYVTVDKTTGAISTIVAEEP